MNNELETIEKFNMRLVHTIYVAYRDVTQFFRLVPFLTLRLLISYIYGAPSKARNANVVYIWAYVWQR